MRVHKLKTGPDNYVTTKDIFPERPFEFLIRNPKEMEMILGITIN